YSLALLAGSLTLIAGNLKQGYELAKRAIRLNPHTPWYFGMLGRCSFVLGLHRESLVALRQSAPDSPVTLLFVAMAHAMLDETPQVAKITARLADEFPNFTPEVFISTYPKRTFRNQRVLYFGNPASWSLSTTLSEKAGAENMGFFLTAFRESPEI